MTLLPRITTSPIVAPSRGTSSIALVDDAHEVGDRVGLALAREQPRAPVLVQLGEAVGLGRRR